ncbi:hypothetical protein SLEP1_g20731 [Rubroshorea leprosula]|uniref:Transmembrane protein n=1 Tax=Rubroshorea leprosula TaxID=152421 RepID=A0AAV5JE65_9ROSI|nr:hypothetical protein SLEP1_g20731 [Rubroshorea leprosula]
MAISGHLGRRQQQQQLHQRFPGRAPRFPIRFSSSSYRKLRFILISLAFVALLPPFFFHFRLRRFHQVNSSFVVYLSFSIHAILAVRVIRTH